ncbi:MAG: transketolase [Polyangiaceae bacterium]|nr:transketolase [Polyangiaceae bacterium]
MTDSAFQTAVHTTRFLAADAVEQAASGHPGTPMALAGIAVDLFSRYLRYVPEEPLWPNRDRFVLSCGHASMLLYSVLHLAGFSLSLDDIKAFRQWGSKTPGHPELGHTPGVEMTTGPLGQGIATAVGMALASKMAGARVNTAGATIIDYRVFAIASDGDLMEGISGEASSIAGHLGLDNLVVIYDDNRITIDGETSITFTEDVGKRYEAYGWFVQRVDGHDPEAVRAALDRAVAEPARPSFIIARTHIAIGAPTKQDKSSAHGAPLGRAEIDGAKRAVGFPLEPFHVPEDAYVPFRNWTEQNRTRLAAWKGAVAALKGDRLTTWTDLSQRRIPADLFGQLVATAPTKSDATRSLGAEVEQKVAVLVPSVVAGSADLDASCKTAIKGANDVGPTHFAGRNLHYGIREHAMGAIMNGLALSGFFIPIGSTFLMFADYVRPAVRLAALMEQQAIYVFTHDSFFVGEDGPTHQPIEHLWALRLIPNLDVVRPADGLECAVAWTHAMTRRAGPTALILSRQKLAAIPRPAGFDPQTILNGAYVVADTTDPTLVLIASGSEVEPALGAKPLLEAKGHRVRVVSVPCWDAFARLPPTEQEAVLGVGARRVSIEAGTTAGWRGIVGTNGIVIGLDRFGASAPAERLAVEFGFTAERVAERIQAAL